MIEKINHKFLAFVRSNRPFFYDTLIAIAIFSGIVFRFLFLDRTLYWHDEAYTLMRAGGYLGIEVNQNLFDGTIHNLQDVVNYQQLRPSSTWLDTVISLAFEDAQHPPIYYLIVRLWMKLFGQSIDTVRSLSAIFSLLTFPCLYLLTKLIFSNSSRIAWMVLALFAVSPLQVLYAREAREYALWSLIISLSSIALLISYKINNLKAWTIYVITIAVSLYTFSLSILYLIGCLIYVFVREKYCLTKKVIYCAIASLIGLVSFVPWLFFAVKSWFATGNVWSSIPLSVKTLFNIWMLQTARLFTLPLQDFGHNSYSILFNFIILALSFSTVIYSIYILIKQSTQSTWLFPVILSTSIFLPLAFLDLTLGGQRSTATRYLMPTFLGIQLSIAFALSNKSSIKSKLKQNINRAIFSFIIMLGIVSSTVAIDSPTAWTKVISYNLHEIAYLINQQQNSLIISSSEGKNFGDTLALSYLVKKDSQFLLVDGWQKRDFETEITIPSKYSNVFLLGVSEQLRKQIQDKHNMIIDLAFSDRHILFWKARRIP